MSVSPSAQAITAIIKRALETHEITQSDHEKVFVLADADGHIDAQERAAISELRDMLQDKTIRIVKG
nr:hypothetical protein [uncultured Holophaga sp.]